ncbi:asparagine synthase (glutamine-hydrolyzing) [Aliarcobacter butzleri]|uniref:asparagine synthase (glutamine-hydrolyzing) n=1 Tax=Aliarcobacter butzleri TaxID=28197 RepID=UPI0021B467CB|nr:asparagine synthase (glutamine-hydrolyzing) [Aliarcobacter butzleri]MCT7560537.1 asparagine synthase (glutamine-hydrolyzing) [Aliarcobacter butzleri]
MCGIVGILTQKPQKIAKNIFLANNQMYRRGPDDEGFILVNNKNIDICYGKDTPLRLFGDKQPYYPIKNIQSTFEDFYTLAFGHRRLSIVDLSSHGHQPMCDESRRYWIVFNGEVYNFKEIRVELESLGYNFVSKTDTEVILKSYIQWGAKCLQKFNGDFAFAIYDNNKEEVFLARDRVGIKPLYYTVQNGHFLFASDIKTLIASKLYTPEVNWEGLYHNFSFSMAPRPMTSFQGVYALKQAHYMKIDCKTLKFDEIEYWDIPTHVQDLKMSENDAINLLEEELKKSIQYRLIADVDVGTFMSGGIDSTTISAMASIMHPNIKAFTLAFDKSISLYDELEEAKATANMHNMQHIISNLDADVVLDNINNMVLGYEEPFFHLAANFAISEIVRNNNVKVVLNGLGGDELFAGYGFYKRLNSWKVLSTIGSLCNFIPNTLHPKVKTIKKISKATNIYQYYSLIYSTFTDSEKQSLFNKNYNSIDEIYKQYGKKDKKFTDKLELLSYLDMKSYIGNHHVHRTDQFTMHFSIEGRFPFLDHNLIEKAFTIPSKYKLNGNIQKYVLRKVAEKYIAPQCLSMQKKGFGLPLEYWFDNQLKDLVNSSIQSLKHRKIFDNHGIENIIQKGTISQKWQLVMCELWFQNFFDKGIINE